MIVCKNELVKMSFFETGIDWEKRGNVWVILITRKKVNI